MLAVKRKELQRIAVLHDGEVAWVTVVRIEGESVRIGLEGPESFQFLREEIYKVDGETK